MTPTKANPDDIIKTVDATIAALCTTATEIIAFATIHHIKDHPHIEVPQPIPEITADPEHILHINQVKELCVNLHAVLTELQ